MLFILISILFIILYSFSEEWIIHIYIYIYTHTGNEHLAGTDSNIFLRLFNSKYSYTHKYKLKHDDWKYYFSIEKSI
ncbi:unnamed protein product [Rotaria sordida]|uniref:PLAT domain-containing protein n=1 Tax=Rotaria sordida TaxID=392033 RepID=A0A814EBY8_9BILA|nr:unnamed protein product [Rotaria sordida]